MTLLRSPDLGRISLLNDQDHNDEIPIADNAFPSVFMLRFVTKTSLHLLGRKYSICSTINR